MEVDMPEKEPAQEKAEMHSNAILTVTVNPAVDTNTEVSQVVAERKLRCDSPVHEPGGGGLNVSRAISRLGGSSTALHLSGGPAGRQLSGLLDSEGIDHHPFETEGLTRVNFTVRETSSNRQFRFGMPGPTIQEQEWKGFLDFVRERLPSKGFVVASGSLAPGVPSDFYARIARMLKKKGTRLILDTSGEPLTRAAEEGVYLLKPNMREFQELVQREITDEREQERQARALVRRGSCEVLVLSLGSAGILLATEEDVRRLRAPSVPIRSKVGAGDSMVAGVVLGLYRDMTLDESARLGIAAGAAAVMTPGTELCRGDDAKRLFKQLQP
jgi:6-phosphofructokinase 2